MSFGNVARCTSVLLILGFAALAVADEPDVSVPIFTHSMDEKIYQQLDAPTRMDFEETPIDEVVDYLKEFHGIEIQLDRYALDNLGLGTDAPVTLRVRGITLRSAISLMLRGVDKHLSFAVKDEVLLITSSEAAREMMLVRTYNVRSLVEDGDSAEQLAAVIAKALDIELPLRDIKKSSKVKPSTKDKKTAATADASATSKASATAKSTEKGQRLGEQLDAALRKKLADSSDGATKTPPSAQIVWFRDQLIVRGTEPQQHAVQNILESLAAGLKGRTRTQRVEQSRLMRRIRPLRARPVEAKRTVSNTSSSSDSQDPDVEDPFGGDPFAAPADPFGGGPDLGGDDPFADDLGRPVVIISDAEVFEDEELIEIDEIEIELMTVE